MKKLFAFALFALTCSAVKAQSEVTYDVQEGKKGGRIEAIYADGSATVTDETTGKTVRINGQSLEASFTIGTPVVYIEITPGEGAVVKLDSILSLIR
jgi:hypothetical protein